MGLALGLGALEGVARDVTALDPAQPKSSGTAMAINPAPNRNLTGRRLAGWSGALLRAALDVVVDDAGGLEERVHDRRADEREAAPLEVLAHSI